MPNDSCFVAVPQFGLKIWSTLRYEIAIREGHHGRANYLRIVRQVLRDNSRRFRRMLFHFATSGSYSLICTKRQYDCIDTADLVTRLRRRIEAVLGGGRKAAR
jgi:hypothetical protein